MHGINETHHHYFSFICHFVFFFSGCLSSTSKQISTESESSVIYFDKVNTPEEEFYAWCDFTFFAYTRSPITVTENFESIFKASLTDRGDYSYTPISKIFRAEKDQFIYYLLPEGSDGQTGIVMGRLSQGELVHAIWEVRDPGQPGKVFYGLCQEYESFHFPETIEATLDAGWVVSEDADTAPYLVFPSYVRFLEVS